MVALSSSARVRIKKLYPLITAHCKRWGGIVPRESLQKLYGPETVSQALTDGILKEILLKAGQSDNSLPDKKIPAVHIPEWDRSKPSWLG